MLTKIITNEDKIKYYHIVGAYFRECSVCKKVQPLEDKVTDNTWEENKGLYFINEKGEPTLSKTTQSYCPIHREEMIKYIEKMRGRPKE